MDHRINQNVGHRFHAHIWLVGAAALAVRIAGLALSDPGIGEADAVARVIFALKWADTPFVFPPTTWPPLQFYLYGTLLHVFPDALYTPLVINVVLGALLSVTMGYLVRRLTGDGKAAIFAAAMVGLYPLAIRFSLIAVPEAMLNLFIFLTLFFLIGVKKNESGGETLRNFAFATLFMALAEWTHMEAWFLMPIFSLLLWGQWRRWLVFAGINSLPILAFIFHMQTMYDALVPPEWHTYSYDSTNPLRQLIYYPALLIDSLSPALIFLGVYGLIRIFEEKPQLLQRPLIPAYCLLALIPPYLLFVFAWDRMRPKEAVLLALFFIPYSAVGLSRLHTSMRNGLGKWVLATAALGMLLVVPYNWKYLSKGNLTPFPRTSKEYRQLGLWLHQHIGTDDAIIFDHLHSWGDYYFALVTRRVPYKAFLTLGRVRPSTAANLRKFIAEHHPKLLVLSKTPSIISAALKLNCESSECYEEEIESNLQIDLNKMRETRRVIVYRISSQEG